MARLARLFAPNVSQLAQARLLPQVVGLADMQELRMQLLVWLEKASIRYGLPVHAWSITQDSIYVLSTPSEQKEVSQVMQALGRHLAAHLGQGAVFTSRYRSCLVESGEHLLSTMIWLELYLHQIEGVEHPEFLPWSSAGAHMGRWIKDIAWIKDHPSYWQLGNTPFERQAKYRQLCEEGLSQKIANQIQSALKGQWALGSDRFISEVSTVASRRVVPGQRGRPRKELK